MRRKSCYLTAITFFLMGIIGYLAHVVFGTMLLAGNEKVSGGLLYPRESETREVRSLDGMWRFAKCDTENPSQVSHIETLSYQNIVA
jgi:hypothetical protein